MSKINPDLASAITKAVSDGFADQLAFTQALIRFGGQRGEEGDVQAFISQRLVSDGYDTVQINMDEALLLEHEGAGRIASGHSKAPIVVARHVPKHRAHDGKSLILNGHVDIVPTGPLDMWTHGPYDAKIIGDRLYGRGGGDMRAGGAANIFALAALRSIGFQPASEVIVKSVVEEESTGNGTLMTHLKGYKADAVLIPEPMDEKLVRANVGVLWFQIEVRGTPVHAREAGSGKNAIDACWRVIGSLRELEADWNKRKVGKLYFENEDHPINLNVAMINGGEWASSVPAWCKVDCRIALFPGVSAASAAKEIETKVFETARQDEFMSKIAPKVTWNGFFSEGYVLEPGSEAENCLSTAHKTVTGQTLESFTTPAYLDTRVYALYDRIPALCYGPLAGNIHGIDEWVSISSLKRITTTIALFIADFCGLEPI